MMSDYISKWISQDDDGMLYQLCCKQSGTFTADVDIYNMHGIMVCSTYHTTGHKQFSDMLNKYHQIPEEILNKLFIEVIL